MYQDELYRCLVELASRKENQKYDELNGIKMYKRKGAKTRQAGRKENEKKTKTRK